ncbi:condensation domain-containing protein [Bradyrhizobium sp. HKCCYLS1011]|uniref:condensation domain-containing protein n=1 Tax=Bradyrhizobium sp. HKCCYLS1011 TaxID=3420733 RepID=UPI003EBF4635
MSNVIEPHPLGSDQAFWWLLDQNHPAHVAMVAEVVGPTTIEDWRGALQAVQRRHPNLCGKIVADDRGRLWFHHVADAPITLRIAEGDPSTWDSELQRELMTRLDMHQAPLAKAALIHRSDRSTLILSIHHAVADAKSILFAVRDVLLVLSGQSVERLAPVASLTSQLFKDGGARGLDAAPEPASPPSRMKPDIFRSFAGETPEIARLTLNPSTTAELRKRARVERTTVHCALVTAAVMAVRQISLELRNAPITIISPSDMRPLLGAGEEVAPLAGGAALTMQPGQYPDDFWQAARAVREDLVPPRTIEQLAQAFSSTEQLMATRPGLQQLIDLFASRGGQKISINNLGAAPFKAEFGPFALKALWGPALLVGYEGERLISAATIDGSLNLLHVSYTPIPSVLELTQQHLIAACAAVPS